jgi:hypothetical protein
VGCGETAARRVLVVCEPEYHRIVRERNGDDPAGRGVIAEFDALQSRIIKEKSQGVAVPVAFELLASAELSVRQDRCRRAAASVSPTSVANRLSPVIDSNWF